MTHLVQSLIGIIPHSTITKDSVKKTYGTCTRLTSFYCTPLSFTSQMLHFLQIKGLWQPCVKFIGTIFPTAFAYFMSLCHVLVIFTLV